MPLRPTVLVVGIDAAPPRRLDRPGPTTVRLVAAGTLDSARSVLRWGAVSVAVVAADALGADPIDGLRSLRELNAALAVIVVATDAAGEDALVAAGAHEVVVTRPDDTDALARVVATASRWAERLAGDERRAAQSSLLHASAAEGYAVLDSDGRILYGGAGVAGGRPIATVVGASAFDWVTPRDRRRVEEVFAAVAGQAGTSAEFETEVAGPGGTRRFLEMTLTNLTDEAAIGGIVATYWDITARRVAEEALAFHSTLLGAIVESSTEAIMSTDVDDLIQTWNPAAERLFGYEAAEAIGRHVSMVVPPELHDELREISAKVATGAGIVRLETLRLHKSGARLPVSLTLAPLLGGDGEVIGTSSTTRDLTALVLADRELEAAEVRFQAAFRRSSFGMAIADLEGYPTTVNPAICQMLGRRPSELIGRRWTEFSHPEEMPLGEAVTAHLSRGGDSFSDERRYVRPDDTVIWVQANVTLVRSADEQPLYFMLQMQDITARKDFQSQLEHRALHDDLTGLPNRALLADRLHHALAAAARAGCDVGVAFVDVDGFKHVNDALGHAAGDRLLVEVGRRLAIGVRPGDTVARFGGDEFVLVCEDITLTGMWGLAERVTEILAERFPVSETDVALHASVGITISRVGSTNQSLLSEADAALYQAKEQGAGQVALFDDSLRTRAASILEGERALSAAIESGEIVAYYQPIVDLGKGRTVGFEALARWQRPDGGLVLPDEFIPLAESTGLIVKLGTAILAQATAYAVARRVTESTGPPLWVSVNLSARQLIDVHLPDDVAAILDANGLDPSLLHLEITETVLMQNLTDAVLVLARLRDLGVRLSIDDFGTGYSSLAYLKQLPVDCLKIDRSFVADLEVGDHSIIKAILGLSEALGMDCIAEGIETEAQRRTLSDLGCRFGQGYLWQRPMPGIGAGTWSRAGG